MNRYTQLTPLNFANAPIPQLPFEELDKTLASFQQQQDVTEAIASQGFDNLSKIGENDDPEYADAIRKEIQGMRDELVSVAQEGDVEGYLGALRNTSKDLLKMRAPGGKIKALEDRKAQYVAEVQRVNEEMKDAPADLRNQVIAAISVPTVENPQGGFNPVGTAPTFKYREIGKDVLDQLEGFIANEYNWIEDDGIWISKRTSEQVTEEEVRRAAEQILSQPIYRNQLNFESKAYAPTARGLLSVLQQREFGGMDVEEIQQKLIENGYDIEADGKDGPKTQQAMVDYLGNLDYESLTPEEIQKASRESLIEQYIQPAIEKYAYSKTGETGRTANPYNRDAVNRAAQQESSGNDYDVRALPLRNNATEQENPFDKGLSRLEELAAKANLLGSSQEMVNAYNSAVVEQFGGMNAETFINDKLAELKGQGNKVAENMLSRLSTPLIYKANQEFQKIDDDPGLRDEDKVAEKAKVIQDLAKNIYDRYNEFIDKTSSQSETYNSYANLDKQREAQETVVGKGTNPGLIADNMTISVFEEGKVNNYKYSDFKDKYKITDEQFIDHTRINGELRSGSSTAANAYVGQYSHEKKTKKGKLIGSSVVHFIAGNIDEVEYGLIHPLHQLASVRHDLSGEPLSQPVTVNVQGFAEVPLRSRSEIIYTDNLLAETSRSYQEKIQELEASKKEETDSEKLGDIQESIKYWDGRIKEINEELSKIAKGEKENAIADVRVVVYDDISKEEYSLEEISELVDETIKSRR